MNLDRLINTEADITGLIDAFRRAVHASPDVAGKIVEQYPELRQPVAVTRDLVAKTPTAGLELERLAVEGLVENGWASLGKKTASHAPESVHDLALLGPGASGAGEHSGVTAKPLDFGPVINSVEDIRRLVAAYRLVLHGDVAVARKVFDEFPGLEVVVERTRAYAEAKSGDLAQWEETGVEALVARGLKTLDEKGVNPFKPSEHAPER